MGLKLESAQTPVLFSAPSPTPHTHILLSPTSQPASTLNDLVDLLETRQEFLVVVTADGVAVDQVAVQVKQLHVTLAHTAPASATQILLMKEYLQLYMNTS